LWKRLQNDLFCVKWDLKLRSAQSAGLAKTNSFLLLGLCDYRVTVCLGNSAPAPAVLRAVGLTLPLLCVFVHVHMFVTSQLHR